MILAYFGVEYTILLLLSCMFWDLFLPYTLIKTDIFNSMHFLFNRIFCDNERKDSWKVVLLLNAIYPWCILQLKISKKGISLRRSMLLFMTYRTFSSTFLMRGRVLKTAVYCKRLLVSNLKHIPFSRLRTAYLPNVKYDWKCRSVVDIITVYARSLVVLLKYVSITR